MLPLLLFPWPRSGPPTFFILESPLLDRCIGTPTYIGRYDDVADVPYRQNSADIYRQYLLIKMLHCRSAWSVRKPKLLLRLWPWLI